MSLIEVFVVIILSSGSQAVSMAIIQSSPDLTFTQIYRALFTSFENQLLFMCKLMTNLLRFTVSPQYTVHFPFSFNDHYSGGLVLEYQAMMTFSWKFMTELVKSAMCSENGCCSIVWLHPFCLQRLCINLGIENRRKICIFTAPQGHDCFFGWTLYQPHRK